MEKFDSQDSFYSILPDSNSGAPASLCTVLFGCSMCSPRCPTPRMVTTHWSPHTQL